MLVRNLVLAGLAACVLAAGAPQALAQGARPSREARQQAREAYAEGQRAFREGRFQDAEVAFLRAYEHVPNPVVWVSVAEARARKGDVPGAIEAYERYLRERPDAPDKATIEQKLQELRATPARLQLASEPAGAQVVLDGEETGKETPAELELPAGEHEIVLRLEGHEEARRSVTLKPGERQQIQVTLQAAAPPEPPAEPDALGDGEPLLEEEEAEPAATPTETGPSTAVWVSAGVAAAGLVGGTVLGFLALSEESAFQENPSAETADRGERYALFADVAFGVAAVGAITALVLHFSDLPPEEAEPTAGRVRLVPLAGAGGAGLGARVDF